jgi:ABC-type bacteriocin/lantibiotic exporter with double-glycine peptidase domain
VPKFGPPFYAQETPDSCLPACLRMVLAAHGLRFSERQLRRLCQCQPMMGTLSTNVVLAAQKLGFVDSIEDRSLRLFDLRDQVREGFSPIVGVNLRRLSGVWSPHAQVVVEIASTHARIHDPMLGRLKISLPTFEAAWADADYLTILVK